MAEKKDEKKKTDKDLADEEPAVEEEKGSKGDKTEKSAKKSVKKGAGTKKDTKGSKKKTPSEGTKKDKEEEKRSDVKKVEDEEDKKPKKEPAKKEKEEKKTESDSKKKRSTGGKKTTSKESTPSKVKSKTSEKEEVKEKKEVESEKKKEKTSDKKGKEEETSTSQEKKTPEPEEKEKEKEDKEAEAKERKPKEERPPLKEELVFGRYNVRDVIVEDPGLSKMINLDPTYVPHSSARHANKPFSKSKISIVERLINSLMRTERYTGKKTKSYRIVYDAFRMIEDKKKENPIQTLVSAIENAAPREEVTRLKFGGISVPKSVDTSPSRRVDIALRNISNGTIKASHKNKKSVAVCLSEELIAASKGDLQSYSVSKRDEIERVAKSAH